MPSGAGKMIFYEANIQAGVNCWYLTNRDYKTLEIYKRGEKIPFLRVSGQQMECLERLARKR